MALPARKHQHQVVPHTPRPTDDDMPRAVSDQGHPHGRLASWVLVGTVITAFLVGGVSLILHAWPVIIACGIVIALAVPIGGLIHIMSDTVGWTDAPPTYMHRGRVIREADRLYRREHSDHHA